MTRDDIMLMQQIIMDGSGSYLAVDGIIGEATTEAALRVLRLRAQSYGGRQEPDNLVTAATQAVLRDQGHQPGRVDGLFGHNTRAAMERWRSAHGTDRVLSELDPIEFRGAAKALDDVDIPRIGALIGADEDRVHAVLEVEAAGRGFDSKGRPKMLFEPHIFWRQLGPGSKRDLAEAEGLAYPRWGQERYPRDSYPRLIKAVAIDRRAALNSASWGLPQIMGFNAAMAGYGSTEAMVRDFLDDEERHLEAMIRFIQSAGLDDELRALDWRGFARGYNGAGYATHNYHGRLAAAYAKWKAIPDTPYELPRDAVRVELEDAA